MDGNFKCASNSFSQPYILYGEFDNHVFPIIYSFLDSKTELDYRRMLFVIKVRLQRFGIVFNPNYIQIDFEYTAYNAVKQVFPLAVITGCFLYFGQAIWRRVNGTGLSTLMKTMKILEILLN